MDAAWYFRPMSPGEINIDPIQREFFTTEALEGAADAIVRETIQNSLDAALEAERVRVQFCLSGQERAPQYRDVEPFFSGLWPHLRSEVNGLTHAPKEGDPVSFLAVEDFQTRGLTGDPYQGEDVENNEGENDFYYFWRNVGRSGKAEKDRGRWGLGKTVFPASSRIHSFLGLTIRGEDPPRLLMGQAVLRTHRIDGRRRYPYGYFGLTADNGFTEPITDRHLAENFAIKFGLERDTETGLSIVIPFPVEEITQEEIIKAVVRQFFYPILSGFLVVKVGRGIRSAVIDEKSLSPMLYQLDEATRKEILPQVKLAEWSHEHSESDYVTVGEPPQTATPKWDMLLLSYETLARVREMFERGDLVAFRVPVWIRWEHGSAAKSYFDVFLQRDPRPGAYRPTFVRQGIIISDAVRRKLPGVHALVVVDDKPLATLLGDCENPAHTEWQDRSGHFRGRYKLGTSVLRFVKNSVPELVRMLSHAQEESDPSPLLDFFFLPEDSEEEQQRTAPSIQPERGPETPHVEPIVNGSKPRFRIERLNGGFTVRSLREVTLPEEIAVRVAYEVRRGNAFRRYQKADFELDKHPIEIEAEGAAVEAGGNTLLIKRMQGDFNVSVTGFDIERDLIVRGVAIESDHDSQV
jgi:hypothetical protein